MHGQKNIKLYKHVGNNTGMSSDSDANISSREVPNYRQHTQPAHMNHYLNNTSV